MAKSNVLTVCITAPANLCGFIICVKDDCGRVMAEERAEVGSLDISLPDGKFKVCVTGNDCAAPRIQERWVEFCGTDPNVSECFSLEFLFYDICGYPHPPYAPPYPPHFPVPPHFPAPPCPPPPCHGNVPCSPYYPYYPQFPVANWQFRFKEPTCGPDGRKKPTPPPCAPKCPPPCKPNPFVTTGGKQARKNRFSGLTKFK
jgi:hypothetical protein